jgi:glc operon protein GlcG
MTFTRPALRLTDEGARALIDAASAHARAMGVPQCIAVVDDGCNLKAFIRMDGARAHSIRTARRKAMTAVSLGRPTGGLEAEVGMKLAIATGGDLTNLGGGLPVIVDGEVIGGIGVGSGQTEQDIEVARAALAAFPGAERF